MQPVYCSIPDQFMSTILDHNIGAAKKTWREKVGLAEMLKGGVIMDVVNTEQARIAHEAGAVAVMALERVPADIRRDGGVSRMSDPEMILAIKAAVTTDVGGNTLQRHHRGGPGVLGDLGLLRRDHIHDHTALEHLGQTGLNGERGLVARRVWFLMHDR